MNIREDITKKSIQALFDDINVLIDKIDHLESSANLEGHYKYIALPALYSILERFSVSYYPGLSSSHRFKKLLLSHSGERQKDLIKIDLLFLCQWDINPNNLKFVKKEHRPFVKATYPKIKKALKTLKIDVSKHNRFIEKNDLYEKLITSNQLKTDKNFSKNLLDSFNCCEVIYHYGRCPVIYEGDFSSRGFITVSYLLDLTRKIVNNLYQECLLKNKLPYELGIT